MKFENWIKRKYPNHYEKIMSDFKDLDLEFYLKSCKYKVGILNVKKGKNKVGDLVLYHRSKEQGEDYNGLYSYDTGWTGNFQINYKFSKKSDMLYDESYQLYATPI